MQVKLVVNAESYVQIGSREMLDACAIVRKWLMYVVSNLLRVAHGRRTAASTRRFPACSATTRAGATRRYTYQP
jgi:hypothetical protein